MKLQPSKLLRLASSGAAGLALAQSVHAATLLQFTNIGANGGNPRMDDTYGDNVTASNPTTGIVTTLGVDGITGTPDIALAYNSVAVPTTGSWDSYSGWDGGRSVLQTEYSSTGANTLTMTFTPTATAGVLINSFSLDEYTGGGNSVVAWSIKNGATTIVSGTWNDFSDAIGGNGGQSTVNTGMTFAQATANGGSVLTLQLVLQSGRGSYQALDNLSFDQVTVPEPSSALLAAAGLGAAAMRRRRK